MLRVLKEQFLIFEIEIKRRLNILEIKNVEVAVDATLQEGRELAVDNFLSGEPTRSFVEKVDTAMLMLGVVHSLQGSENEDESSSDISEKSGG